MCIIAASHQYMCCDLPLPGLLKALSIQPAVVFFFWNKKSPHISRLSLKSSSGFRFNNQQFTSLSIFLVQQGGFQHWNNKKGIKSWMFVVRHSYLIEISRTLCTNTGGRTLLALNFPSLYPIWMSAPPSFPLRLIKLPSFVHFVLYVFLSFSLFVQSTSSYVSSVFVGFGNF